MELHHGSTRVSSSNEFLTLDWQHLFSFQLMASQEEKKCKLLKDFIPLCKLCGYLLTFASSRLASQQRRRVLSQYFCVFLRLHPLPLLHDWRILYSSEDVIENDRQLYASFRCSILDSHRDRQPRHRRGPKVKQRHVKMTIFNLCRRFVIGSQRRGSKKSTAVKHDVAPSIWN